MTETISIQSLEDFSAFPDLIGPGGTAVISVPSGTDHGLLTNAFLGHAAGTRKALLLTTRITDDAGRDVVPLAGRRSAEIVRATRDRLGKSGSRWLVLFEAGCMAWLESRAQRQEWFEKVSTAAGNERARSVWILMHDTFDAEGWAAIKDSVDFFVDVFHLGPALYAQFVTARGAFGREAFFPRQLILSSASCILKPPSLPAPQAVPEAGAAPLADLLQEPYRMAFDHAEEGIIMFDARGTYREANRRAAEILGYPQEEIPALALSQVIMPSSYHRALKALSSVRRRNKEILDVDIRRKSGRQSRIAVTVAGIAGGRAVAVIRDVSEERRAEERQRDTSEYYRAIVDGTPAPQAIYASRKLVPINAAFRALFPWVNAEEGIALHQFFGKANAPLTKQLIGVADMPGSDEVFGLDADIRTPEAKRLELRVAVRPFAHAGKRLLHLTLMDITGQRETARRLEDSERHYRVLLENNAAAFSVVRDGTLAFVNKGYAALLGYASPDELAGKELATCVAGRDKKNVAQHQIPGDPGSEAVKTFEYTAIRSDGSTLTVEGRAQTIDWDGTACVLTSHRDISGHLRAGEDTRRQVKDDETLAQISRAAHSSIAVGGVVAASLDASLHGLGFESGCVYLLSGNGLDLSMELQRSLPEKIATTLGSQNTQEGVTGYVGKTMEPLLLAMSEYPPYLPYRSLFESEKIAAAAYLPLVSGDNLLGIMLLCAPKLNDAVRHTLPMLAPAGKTIGQALGNAFAHERIARAELQYHSLVDDSLDVMYRALPTGAFVFLSPQVERLSGFSIEELTKNPDLWRASLHPDDRLVYSERIANQALGKDEFELEYRLLPKGKAAYRWIRDAVRYHRDESGAILRVTGTMTDITERKDIERKVLRSGELSSNVLESVQEGVVVCDRDLHFTAWNRVMADLTGLGRDTMLGRSPLEEGSPAAVQAFASLLRRALDGEAVSSEELSFKPEGGKDDRLFWGRFSPLRDARGTVTGVVGTITDVTHRKSLEREVRESEETLRNVIDAMGDALMISDLQGRVWEVNREFTNITGFPRIEALGMAFPYPWIAEEEMATYLTWIAALRERQFLRDFDMRWKGKEGQQVAISLNTTLLRNAAGEPMAMLNIARDISERKHLGNELAAKNRQIEMLNRIISKANTTIDFSHIFDVIAVEVLNNLAYDQIGVWTLSEDGSHLVALAALSPDGHGASVGQGVPLERSACRLALDSGTALRIGDLAESAEVPPGTIEAEAGLHCLLAIPIMLNAQVMGVFTVATLEPHVLSGLSLAYLQPIADQIGAMIDRAKLFRQVSDDSHYIHTLLNSLDSVVFTVDRSFRIREMNKAWRELSRYISEQVPADESEAVGKNPEELIPVPSLWDEVRSVVPALFDGTREAFATEFEIERGGTVRTFRLAVNPMSLGGTVNVLVFAQTDITESKKTEEEVKNRNKELVALNAIAASISTSLELDEVLTVAAGQIREISQADIVLCYLRDQATNQLVLARQVGLPDELVEGVRYLDISASAMGSVVSLSHPVRLQAPLSKNFELTVPGRRIAKAMGIQGMVALPVHSKDHVLGVLGVAFRENEAFDRVNERFLGLVGNQLGPVIENAQLYAEVQAQVERITSLYELGKGLSGAMDRRSLLNIISTEVARALPFDRFTYDRVSGDGSLERLVDLGPLDTRAHDSPMEASEEAATTFRTVAERGTPFLGPVGSFPSCAAVPVQSQDAVAGVLAVYSSVPERYAQVHLRLLESIANLTKIAIDRTLLYEDIVAKSRELEDRNKELDDFTYVVSHDLKEPLITTEGYSKIVLREYGEKIDAEGKGYLTSVVQSSARMKGLIDDLLTLSRIGRVSETPKSVSVSETVAEILHDFEFTLRERKARVDVAESLPNVRYNPTQLGMVFRNLISNGIKFNKSPDPLVTVGVREEVAEYVFSVNDNGIGIDPAHFDKIFVIFQRLHRSEDYRGTGAGLTIVKKIIENHRGRIWLQSTPGNGTTFYFTIPK